MLPCIFDHALVADFDEISELTSGEGKEEGNTSK
jgi:hypothetical protein